MGDAAKHLLQSFEALSEADQREVLAELLRHTQLLSTEFPADEELVSAADRIFQEYDQRETQGRGRRNAARFTL